MPNIIGVSESLVLLQDSDNGVIIDKDLNLVVETGLAKELFSSRSWEASTEEFSSSMLDLAQGALTDLEIKVIVASGRMYTIPKGVQNEAKKALEWHKEHHRGGTPVGLHSARLLANGGQIGLNKIRHIAKYFPRHEVDKKGKGFEPGEPNFPSNGRIAWALWGGDSGWSWAKTIVERENKKALTSDGYAMPGYAQDYNDYALPGGYESDVNAFKNAQELDPLVGPEFLARVRLDGSGMDRLYKIDLDGSVYTWDGMGWDTLGHVDGDIWTYDKALDDPYDRVKKSHIVIDADSAIIISARLQQQPYNNVTMDDIDSDEATLVSRAIHEIDWDVVDYSITAAGAETAAPAAGDGQYTPAERSQNSRKQVRDASGKFASQGSRVVVGGDTQNGVGYIRGINPDSGTVTVQYDNGTKADVPANSTEKADKYIGSIARETISVPALDTTGILGQPRTPIDRPNVQMPGTLPALRPSDMSDIINNWPAFVQSQRVSPAATGTPSTSTPGGTAVKGGPATPAVDPRTPFDKATKVATPSQDVQKLLKETGTKITTNAYDHPMLKDWLNKAVKNKAGDISHPNRIWYQPVTADKLPTYTAPVTSAGTPVEDEKNEKIETAKQAVAEATEMTPDNSDVQPLFLALVSPDDPRAVMELVSMVPANSKSNLPMTYKRQGQKWVRDEGILADLNSATPPPVVPLDSDTLQSVLEQVDSGTVTASVYVAETPDHIFTVLWGPTGSLTAAGGADRNRGNAEALRRYWTVGKGAAKIRWGTGGDWTRCVRQLSKYLGPRAKGYCALRHHEVTGLWTGDKKHAQLFGRKGRNNMFSIDVLSTTDQVIERAALKAQAATARNRIGLTASVLGDGAGFTIPLVIPEDIESGDGRRFDKGAIDMRELPLPLMWQIKTADGHMGSVVVGRIDHMERTDQGIGNATGVFDTGEYGQEAERLVREGFIRGVSADMDKFEAQEEQLEAEDGTEGKVGNNKINITKARVMGVTIVPKPAFQECKILLNEEPMVQEESMIPDGVYMEDVDPVEAAALVACGFVAGAIPVTPPNEWFEDPKLSKATPLTVTDEGRVFGHIAAWHVDHIGLSFGTKPPRSKSKYSYFHTGVVRTDNGTDVPVGQLTLAGGHAPLEASAHEAARHYDDTASAVSDVHAGEDAYGIWVAGALRPSATPEQIRALRASAPSGDWRPIKGSLELVAVCQVNVPGFPIARARVASGQVMALVAAGASTLARLKSDPVADLAARITKLEQLENAELSVKADAARERFAPIRDARKAELTARIAELNARINITEDYEDGFAYISREKRQKLAEKGHALPDGSFPISSSSDLKDAIDSYGRAKGSRKAAVRRHIMKRARVLDQSDLIPADWKNEASSEELEFAVNNLRSRIPSLTASAEVDELSEFGDVSQKVREKLAKKGQALPDGSYPIRNAVDLKNAVQSYGRASKEDQAKVRTHIRKRAKALGKEDLIPENWKAASNEDNSGDLGKAFAAEIVDQGKYTPETQPRNAQGKFTQVLARLQGNLGGSGPKEVTDKLNETKVVAEVGTDSDTAKSAEELLGVLDRIDSKALNPESLENIKLSAKELGGVIASLPLSFGNDTDKLRFSDLPTSFQDLVKNMIQRVEDKIGKKDADVATSKIRDLISGGDFLSQQELSSEMSKILRLLT